ncbi:MAG: hypothetical protein GY749_22635 [Desulfobacteraceae bacterium]|nr:hypothetical protein [Desulfobacteraceae bacterium]
MSQSVTPGCNNSPFQGCVKGGADEEDDLYNSTQRVSEFVYSRFRMRLFSHEDIYYINHLGEHDIDRDGYDDNIVDDDNPSEDGFRKAVTEWAVSQNTDGPLYIYLIGKGGFDSFEIFTNEITNEILEAPNFKKYIDEFQNTDRRVIIMIEASWAGSFIDDLEEQEQDIIIITSTDKEEAHMQREGKISFTQFFLESLSNGDSISLSFNEAKDNLHGTGSPCNIMNPRLVPDSDQILGGEFQINSQSPQIIEKSLDKTISANTAQDFYVRLDSGEIELGLWEIESVWAMVTPPNYTSVPMNQVSETWRNRIIPQKAPGLPLPQHQHFS